MGGLEHGVTGVKNTRVNHEDQLPLRDDSLPCSPNWGVIKTRLITCFLEDSSSTHCGDDPVKAGDLSRVGSSETAFHLGVGIESRRRTGVEKTGPGRIIRATNTSRAHTLSISSLLHTCQAFHTWAILPIQDASVLWGPLFGNGLNVY